MISAINAWTFAADTAPAEQIRLAAAAGFDGLELVVSADGPLRFDSDLTQGQELAHLAEDRSLAIVSLATGAFWDVNYGDPDETIRQKAVDRTRRMLDLAVSLGAGAILVVPAVVGRYEDVQPRITYADALHRTLDCLRHLRHDAEAAGVTIALENVWNRFLLSPLEAADLIDRVNSPFVGWYLDIGNTLASSYPQDWIEALGRRIARVHAKDYDLNQPGGAGFCGLGEGSVDWAETVRALQRVGYAGPLTYEGAGEPAEIAQRLRRILDGTPPLVGGGAA